MKVSELMKGHDLVQVFGDTGTCKTTLALGIAREYVENGKKVLYLDSEKNINYVPKGVECIYAPDLNEMLKTVQELKGKKYDLVILDSLGAPAVGAFAASSMKQRGEILLTVTAIMYLLKIYANSSGSQVFVCNQPESTFNKQPGHVLEPWGDKSNYFAKEVWTTKLLMTNPSMTSVQVSAFKSRSEGRGKLLFKINVTEKGVTFKEADKIGMPTM